MKTIGVDIGTGNLVVALPLEDGKMEVTSMRDMFLPVSPEDLASSEIANTQLDYVEVYDGDEVDIIAIIGEDAFRFANIFGQDLRRPMQKGVISPNEIDAIDILTLMLEKLVGGKVDNGYCVYSIPAQAVDIKTPPVAYHEKVFGNIFTTLGYKSKSMNEAMAIIYSECVKENFSGIAFSFGAGLLNYCFSYKGANAISGAVSRAGDWIDQQVAESLGKLPSRITAVKEKPDFDLMNTGIGKKTERRVKESLAIYYENLIRYTLRVFVTQFQMKAEGLDVDEEIPIILSGGTSKPKGFRELFEKVFREMEDEFPYNISEIRCAKDPLTAVATGNLIYAMWEQKKNKGENKNVKKVRQTSSK